jgi:hypothetical protein
MKTLGTIIVALLCLVGITAIVIFFDLFGMKYASDTSSMRGKSGAEVKIESAGSRIERYEHFFALCASVQEKEDVIDVLKSNLSMEEQKKDIALMANAAQRSSLINRYNADSAKSYTDARFKASNLPHRLERAPYKGTNKTSCSY